MACGCNPDKLVCLERKLFDPQDLTPTHWVALYACKNCGAVTAEAETADIQYDYTGVQHRRGKRLWP